MKKLFIILGTLICFAAKSQLPDWLPTAVGSDYNLNTGYGRFDSGIFHARRDTNWTPILPGAQVFWLHIGVDSAVWTWDGFHWTKGASSGGGGGGTNNTNLGSAYRLLNETSQGIKTLNNGFGIGLDSATTGEITITADTSELPTRYTIDSISLLIGTGDNANVGAGYRWLKPATQEIKTAFGGFGIGLDSTTNVNGITITADTSKLTTRYTIDSLGNLIIPFSLTTIGSSPNANAASYNSTTGVFNLQPYSRSFGGVTTSSATPQYAQGQKSWFSNTDTLMSWYGSEDGTETLKSVLYGNYGIQSWYLYDPVTHLKTGSIHFTEPLDFPGLMLLNSSGSGRSQFRQYRDTGGISLGSLSPVGIPDNQFVILNNGHTFVTGYSGNVIGPGERAIADSGYLFNVFGTSNIWGTQYLSSVANGSSSDSILVIHNTQVKKVPASSVAGAISLTTNGIGQASYNSTTGVLNIPNPPDTVNVSNVLSFPGADSTGATDQTATINAAIAQAIIDGKKRVYIPHGIWPVTVAALKAGSQVNKQGIQLISNIEIYGDGNATVIRAKGQTTGDTSTYNWYPIFNGFSAPSNVRIHDLKIDGNQDSIAIYNPNPYVNPTGHNDTSKHYSVQGIYVKQGDNIKIWGVWADSCQGFGIEAYNSTSFNIDNCKLTYNGNGGVGYTSSTATTGGSTGILSNSLLDANNSDNVRIINGIGLVTVTNCRLSNAKYYIGATNWFAGAYVAARNVILRGNKVFGNSAYGFDLSYNGGAGDTTTNRGIIVDGNVIYNNANAGIAISINKASITNNQIYNNGKTQGGLIDTASASYDPAAIVGNNATDAVIENNIAYDTAATPIQIWFIKETPTASWSFYNSIINNNRISNVADTTHAWQGNVGYNSIIYNVTTTNAGGLVPPTSDNNVLKLTNGTPVWGAPFTLTTTGTTGAATFSSGTLNIPIYSGGGGSVALSSITAAAATNTIDNTNYAQEWDWSTASTQLPFTWTANALTTGSLFTLSSTSTAGDASKLLQLTRSGANGTSAKTNYGLYSAITNTGTTSTNVAGYFTASGGTTNYTLYTSGSQIYNQINSIGAVSTSATAGLFMENTTAAAVNAQQYSQSIVLGANGWKTNATAGSQPVKGYIQMRATQSTANPIGKLSFGAETNGFGIANTFSVSSNGVATLQGAAGATLNVNGSVGIGVVHDETNGLQTTSVLDLGTQIGSTLTSLINSSASLSGTTANGISLNLNVTNTAPTNTTTMAGVNSLMQSSAAIAYTTAPAELAGVVASASFGTTNSTVVFPLGIGVDGNINLRTGMAKDITKGYAFRGYISSADGAPTNRVVNYVTYRGDSVDSRMVWAKPFHFDFRGTNMYGFMAGKSLFGGYLASGNDTSTAYIQLAAGTATANTAPLKFTAGTNLTSAEAGAMEYDGTDFFLTSGTPTRYTVQKALVGSATLDFGSTAAQNSADLTISVSGAAVGDPVVLGVPNASTLTNSDFSAWVSSSGTVTVRFNNYSSGAQDPASGTFKVRVIQ